jgi:hypothetical protein
MEHRHILRILLKYFLHYAMSSNFSDWVKTRISHSLKNYLINSIIIIKCNIIVTCRGDYRRLLDWMIGYINILYTPLGTTGNYNYSQFTDGGDVVSLTRRPSGRPAAFDPQVLFSVGARGSVVGWGAMLQAGRSRVQVPMNFFQLT